MNYKMGELFCGPGGLSLGAEMANFTAPKTNKEFEISVKWATDHHEDSCHTFQKNICPNEPDKVICSPVENLDLAKLPAIDGLAFGFPCNDFSQVGEKHGFDGEYGPLYTYGVGVLNEHNPKWFVAENVGGIRSAENGNALPTILRDLTIAGTGYEITPHYYHFEKYGVPQLRHRIVIVGIRRDLDKQYKVPAPTTPEKKDFISASEALENPPIPEDAHNHSFTNQSKTVVERLKHIPPGQNAWYEGIPEELQLNVKGAKLSNIYRRNHPDKPSYTITGSGGGGTHGYHHSEPRALTNRERARLQTFPDDFVFKGGKSSVRRQIGMAVPPKGAKIIFEALLKTLAGVEYESIAPNVKAHQSHQLT